MAAEEERPDGTTKEKVPASPRRDSNWAQGVTKLEVGEISQDALNRNVAGRRLMSPIQGFGKMWQKTYRFHIPGRRYTPAHVISTWKANFPSYWPKGNLFYGPLTGIAPGEVAVLNLSMPGKLKLSTGVLVLYADEESFTLMTPQGHMFAGWITFSAFDDEQGTTVQVQVLIRANDPLYEVAFALGGARKEDKFWFETLKNLAAEFEVRDPMVELTAVCVDKKRQWKRAKNIWHNSAIRSGFYALGAPGRWIAKPFKRKPPAPAPDPGPPEVG